jgi:hypothetical protein
MAAGLLGRQDPGRHLAHAHYRHQVVHLNDALKLKARYVRAAGYLRVAHR